MTYEVHVSEAEVTEALDELKTSIQTLDIRFTPEITSENGLEMTEQFNEINASIKSFLEAYHTFLTNSEASTRRSVEIIKETDADLASNIKLLK